jgi:hypothetical protein
MDGGFAKGPGKGESIPDGKLVRCDDEGILSDRPSALARVAGLVFIALGLAALAGTFQIFRSPDPSPGVTGYSGSNVIFGLMFAVPGVLLLLPLTLRIDPASGTYRECRGLWLFRREITGSAEDFDRLSLKTYAAKGHTTLLLHWRDASRPPFALHTSGYDETVRRGRQVSEILLLPLCDETGGVLRPGSSAIAVLG